MLSERGVRLYLFRENGRKKDREGMGGRGGQRMSNDGGGVAVHQPEWPDVGFK